MVKKNETPKKSPKAGKSEVLAAKTGTGSDGGIKKPHRYRPGTKAKMEIYRLQKTTNNCIPSRNLDRLIREISQDYKTDLKWQASAMTVLKAASEMFVIDILKSAEISANHAGRITIDQSDIYHVLKMDKHLKRRFAPEIKRYERAQLEAKLAKISGGIRVNAPDIPL
jgi:histone H3